MKSGFGAHRGAFHRLTGLLPDVAKGGVRQGGVIRNWQPVAALEETVPRTVPSDYAADYVAPTDYVKARLARDLLRNDEKGAFKAPSLPVQSPAPE
jgi:hypothetical protein